MIESLCDLLWKSLRKSARRLSQEAGIWKTSVLRILQQNLSLQNLNSDETKYGEEQFTSCQNLSQKIVGNPGTLGLMKLTIALVSTSINKTSELMHNPTNMLNTHLARKKWLYGVP